MVPFVDLKFPRNFQDLTLTFFFFFLFLVFLARSVLRLKFMLWLFAAPARLPAFHTCVGANEERLTPKWYKEHGKAYFILPRFQFPGFYITNHKAIVVLKRK